MSAEVDLVASLQRTIQEQKEKIERLERASEADIAKYNTLLDNLSFKQGRGQTCSC
jgi:hypothetical protein